MSLNMEECIQNFNDYNASMTSSRFDEKPHVGVLDDIFTNTLDLHNCFYQYKIYPICRRTADRGK